MPLYLLNNELYFPDIEDAMPDGLLAVGGDLDADRLLLAYQSGIFPWFNAGDPILWWSPDPRCMLFHDHLKVTKSMRNVRNQQRYRITFDWAFDEVIRACGEVPRPGQDGTWITEEITNAYITLHELGIAHSVEVWEDEKLMGGLYGVSLGSIFCGESMFSKASNTSKLALIELSEWLHSRNYIGIDCQIMNDHLQSMGAVNIPRKRFKELLDQALKSDTLKGNWADKYSH